MPLDPILEGHGAYKCVECGRCTYACPASQIGGDFSPRRIMEEALLTGQVPHNKDLWLCMTCGQCTQICQFGVGFHEVVRGMRPNLRRSLPPEPNHGGAPEAMQRLSAMPGIVPRKQRWMTADLELGEEADTLLFVGCTPYFDVMFRYLLPDLLEVPRSAVRLLNAAGISPRLMMDERCCGHDAYWLGDDALFESLARMNVEAVEGLGISRLLAFCPECASTWKQLYPKVVGRLPFEVLTVAEVVSEALADGRMALVGSEQRLAFQDPCRLGRHMGLYDPPRRMLEAMGELVEMPRSREMSACCGNSSFVNCGPQTRMWQLKRVEEALDSGADRLVTACPKCLIHMTCAMSEGVQLLERPTIPLADIHVEASKNIQRMRRETGP